MVVAEAKLRYHLSDHRFRVGQARNLGCRHDLLCLVPEFTAQAIRKAHEIGWKSAADRHHGIEPNRSDFEARWFSGGDRAGDLAVSEGSERSKPGQVKRA